MKRVITIQPVDEHNYIPFINWFKREPDVSYEVVCYRNAEILLPNFDVRHTIDIPVDTNSSSVDMINLKNQRLIDYRETLPGEYSTDIDINNNGVHVYKHTFSNLAREILDGNIMFRPREEDYLMVKEKMKQYGDNVVTINGRLMNSAKAHGRNNTLGAEINHLLALGYTVLNCTIPNPNLPIQHPDYHEIGHECLDYSFNISYFLCSKAVVSIGNAGSITNHMSTQANVIIVGPGGWVDNAEFGYEGYGIFQAKQKVQGNAWRASIGELGRLIEGLEPIKNVKYF